MNRLKWYQYLSKRMIFIIVMVIFFFISGKYARNKHREIKSSPKKYCYNSTTKYYIKVLDDLSDAQEYIDLFENKSPYPKRIRFDFEVIPNNSQVYLLGYEKDSTLAEIVCYYMKNGFGQMVEGYIHSQLLFDKPVNDIANPDGDKAFPYD
ncbi:hypothetical protein VOI54_12500 [Tamlana sp. 2201CG12-4]|uniref:hypothetical protein n=1 Tax=Tamlana sp. 2201CG12-4 TaxID=3112582 RepID=UPI002DB8E05E|nr:hypothetical protein [Tamlana sp. 2201CG12-4]MEC3907841.1 hypothetical protein [Tamlana sp. 2201CG12-4]